MKKYLITIFVLLAMLVIQVGSVAAAPLAEGTAVLVSVSHAENGPVFTFNVGGKFSKSDLKGSLHVEGGADYNLHCTQVDETTVKCTTSAKVSGVNVSVSWGGSTFWTFVPEAMPQHVSEGPTEYCYSVYDWGLETPMWVNYGTYCQDAPAEYGDMINWYNPGWEGTYEYEYLPKSLDPEWCPFLQVEDAYYYPYSVCEL